MSFRPRLKSGEYRVEVNLGNADKPFVGLYRKELLGWSLETSYTGRHGIREMIIDFIVPEPHSGQLSNKLAVAPGFVVEQWECGWGHVVKYDPPLIIDRTGYLGCPACTIERGG